MPIYSQNNIEKKVLEKENEVQFNGKTCTYNDVYNEKLVINMPFYGEKKSNTPE